MRVATLVLALCATPSLSGCDLVGAPARGDATPQQTEHDGDAGEHAGSPDATLGRDVDNTGDAGSLGPSGDAGTDAWTDASTGDGPIPRDPGPCGAPENRPVIDFEDEDLITADTRWTCDTIYHLKGRLYVGDGHPATDSADVPLLTIEAGTLIVGAAGDVDSGTYPGVLVVTRAGRIDAQGTAQAPIVFTADGAEGERAPGDWGGVVLLGRGTINAPGGEANVEGLQQVPYGAPEAFRDASWNCGRLRFVRIEFAGFVIGSGNELNGLTVAGCGWNTTLEYIQVHRGDDDGIELFGGSADLRHVLITGAQDDSLDWDQGYTGRMQFVAVQQHRESSNQRAPDRGIEGDGGDADGLPISSPRIFNLTLWGPDEGAGGEGMMLREGTELYLGNAVIAGFRSSVLDVAGERAIQAAEAGTLEIVASVFAPSTEQQWPVDDADAFDERAHFLAADRANREYASPTPLAIAGAWATYGPDLRPALSSPTSQLSVVPTEAPGDTRPIFFDPTARYAGAFEPGGLDWTAGWTAFPEH